MAWRVLALEIADLTKTYGRTTALDGVSFSARPGELLGVIGPNGAGKTTLFECIAGVLPCDRGTVRVFGQVARGSSPQVFYLPDGIAPWPAQRLGWALRFVRDFFGGHDARRAELIETLALERLLDQRIGTLSKGQRKRALLAMGLLTPQPVLLADEPFDGLDLRQTCELMTRLRGEIAWGRTLVLSIHQIADAARVCDRFVLLSDGRVRGEGTLDELAARAPMPAAGLEEVFLALT